jgi:hypothetical protein
VNHAVRAVAMLLFFLKTALVPDSLAQQSSSGDMSQLVKSGIDAVVLIVVNDAAGKPVLEGSGFLVASDGRIVTNHHVIASAFSAIVKLNNGAFFPVEGIIADDPEHDLALIKVPGKNLPYLGLEDSDSLSVGQRVLAIGSPLGLENSVSDGIVSGFRNADGKSWIQTTAPASHGNSGGPLLVMGGKVAGVLTWKVGEGENLNFAVPSKLIVPLLGTSSVQPLGAASTAFMRSELKKDGDKWVGKVRSLLPYDYKTWAVENVKWCTVEMQLEIDKVADTRIEGRSMRAKSFDAKKCKPGELEWQSFTWIPK